MAEVAVGAGWRRPAWWQRWQLGRSAILAVAAAHSEMQRQRGGGGGNNSALEAAAWRMLIIILIITMRMIIDGGGGKGGGEGWLHALLAVIAMEGNDNRNGGPKGRPNNLQSAWRLAELFFWSDLS